MATIRLKKYDQGLLCQVWPDMPPAVRCQLAQDAVRNVEIGSRHIDEAVARITVQRSGCQCKARSRRLDALLTVMRSSR
jgi:hypothetical protein